MNSGKIHVESMAVVDEKFADKLDEILEKKDPAFAEEE